ncbi:GGDEF domain-containing protein [soil metagenome]
MVLNCVLLLLEACIYFAAMAALFRVRHRHGIGLFMCGLGVMHFLETYLAAVFYVQVPFGIISPGSAVLFSGKVAMLLLLYIKDDARAVRQPIFGLFLGNLLIMGLVLILREHTVVTPGPGRVPDLSFLDEMGWLMLWGTLLLLVDSIAIVLLYEQLGKKLIKSSFWRILASMMCILSFDQAGFFLVLHMVYDAPYEVFWGGWIAKMLASLLYSGLAAGYLRWIEELPAAARVRIGDVFDTLTYREKYEALLARSSRDALTGVLNREQFDQVGHHLAEESRATAKPLSVLVLDIDHFKSINDRLGHVKGDEVLKLIAQTLVREMRGLDKVFRYGGEEFVILCADTSHTAAVLLAERLRVATKLKTSFSEFGQVTISLGIATLLRPEDSFDEIFTLADQRLYQAKAEGRDCVVGAAPIPAHARNRRRGDRSADLPG